MALDRRDNQRVIRAPRGTALERRELADRGAAADAHEQSRCRGRREPAGARGLRRHRPGGARLALLRRPGRDAARSCGDDETLCVQSGKPVGVFRTHPDAPRVLIANSNLVAHWASWDKFHELDRIGPDDVRPDDRGLLDLHRQPGDHPGHLRDLRRVRAPALRRRSLGPVDPDRRARRHGRRPAARRDHGRGVAARGGVPARARIERRLQTRYLDRMATDLDEALAIIEKAVRRGGDRCRSACSATPPRSTRSWCAAACARTS